MKTVNYLRISTLAQDLERQEDQLFRYNNYKSNEVVEKFADTESGTHDDRQFLRKMLEFVSNPENGIQEIAVDELSRLGRTKFVLEIIEKLNALKINLHSIKESINTLNPDLTVNANAALLTSILSGLNQYELSTIKHRMQTGRTTAVKRGNYWGGSIVTYGYDSIDKKLTINESEEMTVKYIFDEYIKTKSFLKVANTMNANKVTAKKGGTWSDDVIRKLLKDTIYVGKLNYSKQVFDLPQLQIISNYTFIQVQHIIQTNSKPANNKRNDYKLNNDRIICGVCGRHYSPIFRPTGKFYMCLSRKYAHNSKYQHIDCNSSSIGIEKLTKAVELMLFAFGEQIFKENIDTNTIDTDIKNCENEITTQEKMIKNTLNDESKLLDFVMINANITKEIFNKKLEEIQEKRAKIEKYLQGLKLRLIELKDLKESKVNIKLYVKELQEKGMSKEILNKVIDKIMIYPSAKQLTTRKNDKAVEVHMYSGSYIQKIIISPYSDQTRVLQIN